MNKKMTFFLAAIAVSLFTAGCGKSSSKETEPVIHEDMQEDFEKSGLLSANIGIFSKTESGDSVSYGECGSGVIIKKEGNVYYALTCAHVVSTEGADLLVFTTNTELTSENIPGMEGLNILSQDAYDSMLPAEALYCSQRDDLAVIQFTCEEELQVMELADDDPVIGDRIMCIGNPQNDWFAISYGEITSNIEKFGELQNYPSNAMRHSAYIQVGSSGGAAVNEAMKLVGITPGASFSLDGATFEYGVMIPVSEINICLEEWK